MKLFNISINKYFHMIPLWKSPVKQPLELPVDVGFGPVEVPVELPELSRRDSINKNNLQTVTFFFFQEDKQTTIATLLGGT